MKNLINKFVISSFVVAFAIFGVTTNANAFGISIGFGSSSFYNSGYNYGYGNQMMNCFTSGYPCNNYQSYQTYQPYYSGCGMNNCYNNYYQQPTYNTGCGMSNCYNNYYQPYTTYNNGCYYNCTPYVNNANSYYYYGM